MFCSLFSCCYSKHFHSKRIEFVVILYSRNIVDKLQGHVAQIPFSCTNKKKELKLTSYLVVFDKI